MSKVKLLGESDQVGKVFAGTQEGLAYTWSFNFHMFVCSIVHTIVCLLVHTFVHSFIHTFVRLLRSKLTPTHSLSIRSPKFQCDAQPLGTKKNHGPSWDKKSRNLMDNKNQAPSRDNKKNHTTSGDKKNHATSQDKKNHATVRDKKSGNLWDEKSCNLSGQINHALIRSNCV